MVTNAGVPLTTYLGDALDSLRGEGVEITDETAATCHRHSTTTSTTAPTPSTSTLSSAAKAADRYASPHGGNEITKTTRFVRLLSRPLSGNV